MKKNIFFPLFIGVIASCPITSILAVEPIAIEQQQPQFDPTNPGGMIDPSQDPFHGIPPFPIHADGTPFNEKETAEWQQKADAVVNDYVASLSDADKATFYGQVDELTKVLNTMSEDDWKKVIAETNNMMPQAVAPEAEPEVVEAVPTAQEPQTSLQEDKKLQAQIDKAVKMITNIITRTERFLRSASRIHELSGKIQQWVSQDKIKEWQVDLTWNKLKGMIEQLNQIMHTFKDSKDPKTKKLRYIPDLIKNEALYSNLSNLSALLTKYEPKVEAPDFGMNKITAESRAAIKELLGAYAEAFFSLNIMEDLGKIIEAYEPRAKAHKEEEAAHTKRSLEEAKKRPETTPTRIASSPRHAPTTYTSGTSAADYATAGQAPAYPSGGYPAGGYYEPAYYGGETYQPSYQPQGGGYAQPQGGGYAPGAPSEGRAAGGAPTKEQKPETKPSEPKPEAPKPEEDYITKKKRDEFDKQLTKVIEIFEDTEGLDKFGTLVTEDITKSPVTAEMVTHLKTLITAFTKVTNTAKALKLQLGTLSSAQKSTYTKDIKGILNSNKSVLKNIKEQLEAAEKGKAMAPPAKRYFYFGEAIYKGVMAQQDPELAKKVTQTTDISKLAKAVTDFDEVTQQF
jgi:hypothetical protein